MTPQEIYRKNKHILDAWERGEKVECRPSDPTVGIGWHVAIGMPSIANRDTEWRVATPQRIEARHIKPGAIIHKATWKPTSWAIVLSVTSTGLFYYLGKGMGVTFDTLNDPTKGYTIRDPNGEVVKGD
jgi:hypothetical protein